MSFTVPLRTTRRKTTLPDPPRVSPVVLMTDALKERFMEPIKFHMQQYALSSSLWTPDPWDEAVRSIERRHDAEAEWPWPE